LTKEKFFSTITRQLETVLSDLHLRRNGATQGLKGEQNLKALGEARHFKI